MADVLILWRAADPPPSAAHRLEAEIDCGVEAAIVDELFVAGSVHYGRADVPCTIRARYVDTSGGGLHSIYSNTISTVPEPAGGLVVGLVFLIVLARCGRARRRHRRRCR